MCGICGISWKDEELAHRMLRCIACRGPDGHAVRSEGGATLGHARLAIIGLSAKGLQPMGYRGLRITFNGEIFNYQELQRELESHGHRFTTKTDTEVILAAYAQWGAACLNRLNGMFAFCIHDLKRQELFLARDRFGIKPLYYALHGGKLSFSSEINGLRGLTVEPKISARGLSDFFTFRFTLGERTMLEGIKKLLPAHSMLFDLKTGSASTPERYYTLKPMRLPRRAHSWYATQLRIRIERAVARWMVSDVPVSCLLSGGIDSSVIALLASKHNTQLNTFSMGFETTNELGYARQVAAAIGTHHHEILLDEGTLLDNLGLMIAHMDEPIGDPGFLPVLVLSKEIRKLHKVVLSGDGGDEILTGYDRYKLLRYGWWLRHGAVMTGGKEILSRLQAMRGKNEYSAFLEIIRLFSTKELESLGVQEADASEFWGQGGRSLVERAQEFDIATLLPNDFFMKADKMSSAYGLEQRVPFMDHELVEFCLGLPPKEKLRFWNEKRVLKDAFSGLLPDEIVRRRKHGFNVPIDHWFKGVLGETLEKLLQRSRHGLYNKRPVEELLTRMRAKGTNYKENFVLAQKLWSILVFELWHEHVFGSGNALPSLDAEKNVAGKKQGTALETTWNAKKRQQLRKGQVNSKDNRFKAKGKRLQR